LNNGTGNNSSPLSTGIGGAVTGGVTSAAGGAAGLPKWLTGLAPQGVGMAGQALNLPNVITSPLASLAKGLLSNDMKFGEKDNTGMTDGVINSLLKAGATALIPGIGLPLSVLSMFGFNPSQGIRDWAQSDSSQRDNAGYNGGFFGNGSWSATNGAASPTGTYSGSGIGNTQGPGSGSNGTPTNYTAATSQYGYNNPASSYASQPSQSESTSSE
jgi:hypothetical protein